MKIKKNDTVFIAAGKDRGKKGKVLKVFPLENTLVVEGVNVRKRHRKPKRSGEKGQIIQYPFAISAANAMILCPKCGKPARVGYREQGEKKVRICKKCDQEI